jgi:AcrR family transcriptional regulator
MPAPVKKRRTYNSPRRREQAAATRRQILSAAQRLFESQGYSATSMAAIAAEAGVVPKTVYLAFETKSGLLRALWHLLLRGERAELPVAQQAWYRQVIEEPDPERQLRLAAHNSRLVKERAAALMEVIRDAAAADPEVGALWERIETDFHDNQHSIVKSLHKKGALKKGLGVDRAADILWTINHPTPYLLLVGRRGWTPAAYEKWLAALLCRELLEPPSPACRR